MYFLCTSYVSTILNLFEGNYDMTTTYTFTSSELDAETGLRKEVTHSFETDADTWSGYSGPMLNFFTFLKGCGFVFNINSAIGIMDEKDQFTSADSW